MVRVSPTKTALPKSNCAGDAPIDECSTEASIGLRLRHPQLDFLPSAARLHEAAGGWIAFGDSGLFQERS